MNNFKQPGKILDLTAPGGGVVAGTAYLIGGIFGVAANTVAAGSVFQLAVTGVYTLPKTSAQAWTEGQRIYRNVADGKMDNDPTVGPLVGVAVAVAANPTATGDVRLNGAVAALLEGAQVAIADLDLTTLTDSPASADALRDNITAQWETQLEGKINAILAALRTVGLIS